MTNAVQENKERYETTRTLNIN